MAVTDPEFATSEIKKTPIGLDGATIEDMLGELCNFLLKPEDCFGEDISRKMALNFSTLIIRNFVIGFLHLSYISFNKWLFCFVLFSFVVLCLDTFYQQCRVLTDDSEGSIKGTKLSFETSLEDVLKQLCNVSKEINIDTNEEAHEKTIGYISRKLTTVLSSFFNNRSFSSGPDAPGSIKNSVVISLDGSKFEVMLSYLLGVTHYLLWQMQSGICVDASPLYGKHKKLHTTAEQGTFHFVIEFDGKMIDVVFDGMQAWFYGVLKKNNSFQFKIDKVGRHYIPNCQSLKFDGRYVNIAPDDDAGKVQIGLSAFRDAFNLLYDYTSESSSDSTGDLSSVQHSDVKMDSSSVQHSDSKMDSSSVQHSDTEMNSLSDFQKGLGTIVIFLGEAPKFYKVLSVCCESLVNDKIKSLNDFCLMKSVSQPGLGLMVRYWGSLCKIAMNYVILALAGEPTPSFNEELPEITKFNIHGINTIQDILDNVCLFTRTSPLAGLKKVLPAYRMPVPQPCFKLRETVGDIYARNLNIYIQRVMSGDDSSGSFGTRTKGTVEIHQMIRDDEEGQARKTYEMSGECSTSLYRKKTWEIVIGNVEANESVRKYAEKHLRGLFNAGSWQEELPIKHSGLLINKETIQRAPGTTSLGRVAGRRPLSTLARGSVGTIGRKILSTLARFVK